jgi:hypothetical protein
VHVISNAAAGIDAPPEPLIAAPVNETDAPPVSVFVLRKLPESVAVFVHGTIPETAVPTAHVMLLPALYATPIVACVAAVTATVTVPVCVTAPAGAALRTPMRPAVIPARSRLTIPFPHFLDVTAVCGSTREA